MRGSENPTTRTLLVGLDGADWEVLLPLLDDGKLPNLARLVEGGTIGKCIATGSRDQSDLWTSVATGTLRDKHGIVAGVEPKLDGRGLVRASSLTRQRRAVWSVLAGNGSRCQITGWPASGVAERLEGGVVVSDEFWGSPGDSFEHWRLGAGAIHPERLRRNLAELRVHPKEIGMADLVPLVPRLGELLQAGDRRALGLAQTLALVSSTHAAATAVMQKEPWDFAAVWYGGIGETTRGFGDFHGGGAPWADVGDVEAYGGVVEGMYRFHDLMLGVLMELAGEETAVVVVSGQGEPAGEARALPGKTMRGDKNYGLFVMAGPGIKGDELVYGTSVLDLVPTVLHYCGLPVGADLPGKVLVEALEEPGEVATVPSWEEIDGDFGEHPGWKCRDPLVQVVMRKRGIVMGVIGRGSDVAEQVEEVTVELAFQRAKAALDAGRLDEAVGM
ncbi:MAG: alkaline phosphatase family protein, partial [Verrucomicrobiales bacterium]|nr:alkaline phosphatase family protein [Verrucomicrobiales bacterium]